MPTAHSSVLKPLTLDFKPTLAWVPILAIVSMVGLCLIAKAGTVLRVAYPTGCLFTALWLFFRYPTLYLGFTWWVWFLTPFLRRVIDLQTGWLDPNPVMLAPFLTSVVTVVTLVQSFPRMYWRGGLPFLFAIVAVIYGWLVGVIHWSLIPPSVPLLNWLVPILFGFHLFANWRNYAAYRQIMQRVFLWGVLVMGAYGIIQYLVAPPWDRLWLMNQDTQVFGIPEPLGIRVFSTMNSTQPFACVMSAGLVLLFSDRGGARFLAAGVGYLSFLLSLARSSWLGWTISLALFTPLLKQRLQIRLVFSLLAITLFVLPFAAIDPFADVIHTRMQSLFNITNDVSFNARVAGYSNALGLALSEVIGQGLGGIIISDSLGLNDSGILSLFFILGWFGTVPYLIGISILLIRTLRYTPQKSDLFAVASRAIAIGTFAQMGLNESMLGVFGMVLWSFLGLTLAAQQYYSYQHFIQTSESTDLAEMIVLSK